MSLSPSRVAHTLWGYAAALLTLVMQATKLQPKASTIIHEMLNEGTLYNRPLVSAVVKCSLQVSGEAGSKSRQGLLSHW